MAINITTTNAPAGSNESSVVEKGTYDAKDGYKEIKAVQHEDESNTDKHEHDEETTTTSDVEDNDEDDLSYLSNDDTDEEEDEDSEDENDEEESEDEDGEPVTKKKSGFKKRIDKLTKKISELEERLAAGKGVDNSQDKSTTPKVEEQPLVKPKLDDFENYDDYIEALTDYKLEVKEKEYFSKQKQAEVKNQSDNILKSWDEKVKKAQMKYKDWSNIAKSNIPLTEKSREFLLDSEQGADLVYYLYKNPGKAKELTSLSDLKQVKLLTEIESKLANKINPRKVNTTTKAPEPIKPINKSGVKGSKKDPEAMTTDEYIAYRRNQLKNK